MFFYINPKLAPTFLVALVSALTFGTALLNQEADPVLCDQHESLRMRQHEAETELLREGIRKLFYQL